MIKTSLLKALIGWKKAGPPKKPLLFWSCKQAISTVPAFHIMMWVVQVLFLL